MFTIALIQMKVIGGDPLGNVQRAAERVTEAARTYAMRPTLDLRLTR